MEPRLHKFGFSPFEELPVVDEADQRRPIGVVTRRDIFKLYNHEVLRRDTLGLKFVHREPERERTDYVEMPENHEVEAIPVSSKMAGKTLRELDLRNRYHVNVVAVRHRQQGQEHRGDSDVPDPQEVLRRTHTLIVTGTTEDIERMRRELGNGKGELSSSAR